MVCVGLRSMFEEFFIKIPSYARSNKVHSILSNERLANLKKNYWGWFSLEPMALFYFGKNFLPNILCA